MSRSIRRILSVDDCEADQFLNLHTIRAFDDEIEMVTAFDGEEAIAILSDPTALPDVILLDLNMPRMGGFEFIEEIGDRISECPIIVLSSTLHPDDLARIESDARVAGFLPKPLPRDWHERVEDLLASRGD